VELWEKRVRWLESGLLKVDEIYMLPFLEDVPHIAEECIRLINIPRIDPRYMTTARCDEI